MFSLFKRFVYVVLPLVVITAFIVYFISINIPSGTPSLVLHNLQTAAPTPVKKARPTAVNIALTTVDQQNHLTPQTPITFSTGSNLLPQTEITVDDHTTYQRILGFGASLTGSTVWELEHELTQQQRDALMKQFFDPVHGIGIDLLRQPIGASDQDAPGETAPYQYCSYDDNYGVPDINNLSHFSIQPDIAAHTIDLLQQARHFNPQLRIIAAPWCIPRWMLTTIGGYRTLNPAYYALYAQYLLKFIQAYETQTQPVPIWGIIPQNEPLYSYANFGNNMTASEQSDFIANYLGPLLAQNNIHTNILTYDHNWDHPEYPEQVLAGPAARYVVGTSWHQYAGTVQAQTAVHNMFPNKGTFFTEDSPPPFDVDWGRYMPEAANRIIDILDNWSESYIQWTLVSDTQLGPGVCSCGADIYVDNATGTITYSLAYYLLGQFSKYVKPQAYRIASTDQGAGNIRSVAFKNPDGSIALVAYNDSSNSQIFGVTWAGKTFTYALPSNAIATFTWSTK